METVKECNGALCRLDAAGRSRVCCVLIMLSKVGRFLYRPLFLLRRKIPLLYWNGVCRSAFGENRKAGFYGENKRIESYILL